MAVTKIWAVKGSVKNLVDYVDDPMKTMSMADDGMKGLFHVLDYAAKTDKTEQRLFVSGMNCVPEIAVQQMILTKKQYGKTDKILAFHAYQSFKPGEVTPQQCHEIGVKLAREMWGDRFQVLVTTHLDKSHLHNHFAVNSVSFRDGGKYNSCKAATQRLRDVSDNLCREYGLSVIKNPGKSPHRMLYIAERNGEPTRYNVYRQAIDKAIAASMTMMQFDSFIKKQGFEMKKHGKFWTIKMIGDDRATRLYRLGEKYTGQAIKSRILEGGLARRVIWHPPPKPTVTRYKLLGTFQTVTKHTGFRALYYYYLYRMGVLPRDKPRPPSHPILWEEVKKVRQYSEQARLLVRHKIDTPEQLKSFVGGTRNRMDDLIRQRTVIQNKLRREKEPEVIQKLKAQKTALTQHIAPLRRDLRTAEEIEARSIRMREKLAIIREHERQQPTHNKSKERRDNRENARNDPGNQPPRERVSRSHQRSR